MTSESATGSNGNDEKTEQQKKDQQARARAAAAAAAGKPGTGSYRVTSRGDDDSTPGPSKGVVGGYGYGNPPASTTKATGDGSSPVMAGNNGTTNVRTLSDAERARQGNDNGGNDAPRVAKAIADKPAEPTISPEEQEQQRIAAEIRQRRRRVAGYRSLLSPSRQDNLQSTLGGGGTV